MDLSLNEFKLKKKRRLGSGMKIEKLSQRVGFPSSKNVGSKKSDCITQLLLIKKSRDFNERGHENTRINFV